MTIYQLKITTINGVKTLPISSDQTIELLAGENTKYQIIDENGQLMRELKMTQIGQDDLAVHLGHSDQPSLIIKDYYSQFPIENGAYLNDISASFATASEEAPFILASEVVTGATTTETSLSTLGLYTAGLVAATSITATALSSKKSSSSGQSKIEANVMATQPEQPIIEPKEPILVSVTLDPITSDNIINVSESQEDVEISGSFSADQDVTQSEVTLQIGALSLPAQVEGNRFTAKILGSILAEQNTVIVNIKLANAESEGSAIYEHEYQVDTQISAPMLRINPITTDDIINAVEKRGETILVSGSALNVANSEAKAGDVVELIVGELVVRAPLDEQLNFEVPVSTIALVNHKTITATLVTQDSVQNSITATAEKTITVDDVLNVSVAITSVDQDNLINIADSTKQITLNGTYTADSDVKANSVKVSVMLKGEAHQAVVNEQDKTWTLTVDGSKLVNEQGENTITANITAEDNAGNSAEASTSHLYHVDTLIDKPIISILSIAEDDVIDAAEAKGSITIRGIVENAEGDRPVILRCPCSACHGGWKEVEAQVQPDGKFEVNVLVSETSLADAKLKSEERKIKANYTARDQAGNEAQADEVSRSYELDINDRPEINITQIGNNFDLTAQATTRISGTITEFGGIGANATVTANYGHLYNVGQNARLIRMVKLVIGEKTYQVGFNGVNKTFYADIPTKDLAEIAGKEVQIDFSDILENTQDSFYKFNRVHLLTTKNGKQTVDSLTNLTPTAKQFTLEGNMLVKNGDNSYSIKADTSAKTEIRGVVKGDVAEGELIDVKVGNHTVQTTVQSDKTFSVTVDNAHLANNTSKVVTATLASDSSVRDDEIYLDTKAVSANFVSQHKEIPANERKIDHTKDDYNFFYPIDKMDTRDARGGLSKFLFLRKVDIGGTETPFKVKFHFLRDNEINEIPANTQGLKEAVTDGSVQEVPDYFKDMFRYAYKELARYTNLEFEEANSWQDVDGDKGTLIYLGDLQQKQEGAAAIAYQGGNLVWDPNYGRMGTGDGYYHLVMHEVLHTLNLRHTHDAFSGVEYDPDVANATNHIAEASSEFSKLSYWNVNMFDGMRDIGVYDLAYLHYRFGVNRSHRAGDDVYTFKNYDARKVDRDVYIWDGNGIDTFDASAENEGVTVNLTPGSWNYRGTERKYNFITDSRTIYTKQEFFGLSEDTPIDGALRNSNAIRDNAVPAGTVEFNNYNEGQSFIGYGTQIENLIGSKFADKLTGNNADNNIFGGAGDDVIAGGLGDDFINGGEGDDLMFGGEGNDTYVVDSYGDVVTEEAEQGIDHVYSLIDYTLDNHVENLTLIGNNAKIGTGNELNNIIRGNDSGNTLNGMAGDDILIGGLGKDTLIGGAGNDIFVFDSALNGKADTITDFIRGEDKIQLSKAIFSAISDDLSNLSQHLFYDAETGKLSYNAENGGVDNAVTFAVVTGLGSIDNNTFILG